MKMPSMSLITIAIVTTPTRGGEIEEEEKKRRRRVHGRLCTPSIRFEQKVQKGTRRGDTFLDVSECCQSLPLHRRNIVTYRRRYLHIRMSRIKTHLGFEYANTRFVSSYVYSSTLLHSLFI